MRLKNKISTIYFIILLSASIMGGYFLGSRKQKVEIAATRLASNGMFAAKSASASGNTAQGDTQYQAVLPTLPVAAAIPTSSTAAPTAQPAIVSAPAPVVSKKIITSQPKPAAPAPAPAPAPTPAPAPAPVPAPAQVDPTPMPAPAPMPAPTPTTKVS